MLGLRISLAVPPNEQCYEQTMLLRRSRQETRGTEKCGLVASGVYPPISLRLVNSNRKDEVSLYLSGSNTHETQANLGTHRTQ